MSASSLGTTLITLFLTSLSSTFEVLLECSIGFVMARVKAFKLLNKDRIRFLSKLWFNLFIPSLFFIGISQAFSAEVFRKLYMIFVFGILLELLGMVFGKLLFLKWIWREKLSPVSRRVLNLTLVCHTSVSLPLVFLEALCKVSTLEKNPIFNMTYLKAHDSSVTASSVFIIPTEFIFYTYGYHSFRLGAEALMREEQDKKRKDEMTLNNEEQLERLEIVDEPVMNNSKQEEELEDEKLWIQEQQETFTTNHSSEKTQNFTSKDRHEEEQLMTNTNDNHNMSNHSMLETSTPHESAMTIEDEAKSPIQENSFTWTQKVKKLFLKHWPKFKEFLINVLSPPLVSICLAILVALIPPVKEFLIVHPPIFISSLKHICETFSQAVSPAALIVLGGNLALTLLKENEENEENEMDSTRTLTNLPTTTTTNERCRLLTTKLRNSCSNIGQFFRVKRIHPLAIALSVFVKLIIFPLIGVGLVAACVKLQILPTNDPILILVVLIQFGMPMSMSLAGLSSLNKDYGQEEVCELLLWHYLLCPFTLSLFSTWFLSLSCQFLDEKSAAKLCRV